MNKSLAFCSLFFLAGCGSQHSLGSHTVRDLGDAHWVGTGTSTGAYLTPGQFAGIAKIPEDSLAEEGPAQLFDVNINVGPDTDTEWKQRGPFEDAGTLFGLRKLHPGSNTQATYYLLPSPSRGFISCLPVKSADAGTPCLIQITWHGVNARMPIEPRAIANWRDISTGLENIVSAAVDKKCLIGGWICS
jgi:hypothetical protein